MPPIHSSIQTALHLSSPLSDPQDSGVGFGDHTDAGNAYPGVVDSEHYSPIERDCHD
jgi:hypothetical protein